MSPVCVNYSLFVQTAFSLRYLPCVRLYGPAHGEGYAWSPAALTLFVEDTVAWRWEAPPYLRVAFRVFSVSSPSGNTYEGGPFTSGEARTAAGRHLSSQTYRNDEKLSCLISKHLFPT